MKRKHILIGLICGIMAFSFSAAAVAQQNDVNPQPAVVLTAIDKDLIDFIEKSNNRQWVETTYKNVDLMPGAMPDTYLINEQVAFLVKTDISRGPFSKATQIASGDNEIFYTDFSDIVKDSGNYKVKSITVWRYAESKTMIIEKIIVK